MNIIFLSATDFFSNIVEGLWELWLNIQNADWTTITTQAKNWILGGGMLALVIKAIPFLKNSNKPILKGLGEIGEALVTANAEIKKLKQENATLKDGVKATLSYLETTANINLSSKVLSEDQKVALQTAIITLQSVGTELTNHVADEVEKAAADGVITQEEAINLAEHIPVIEKTLGTPIANLIPKGDSK